MPIIYDNSVNNESHNREMAVTWSWLNRSQYLNLFQIQFQYLFMECEVFLWNINFTLLYTLLFKIDCMVFIENWLSLLTHLYNLESDFCCHNFVKTLTVTFKRHTFFLSQTNGRATYRWSSSPIGIRDTRGAANALDIGSSIGHWQTLDLKSHAFDFNVSLSIL